MGILIVEPDQQDAAALQESLKRGGYVDVIRERGMDGARERLGLGGGLAQEVTSYGVDLVILCLPSPEECADGCRLIKESYHYQDVPIIVATGAPAAEALPFVIASGGMDYLRKPFLEVELLARVRSALRLKYETDRRKSRERELIEATRQLSDLNVMLSRLSLLDSMTGIPNRRNFERVLDREWRRGIRAKRELSLIMIDVDYFKAYNDTYGHQQGDECLKRVASVLREALRRPGDVLGRYGGEEFSVILPDTPIAGASFVAEHLRQAVEQAAMPHVHSKVSSCVTISLGVACILPTDAGAPDELVRAADQALYAAKGEGRNRVETSAKPRPETGEVVAFKPRAVS